MAEDNLPFTDLEAHIVSEVHQWLGEQGTEFSLSGLFGTFVSSIKERLGAPKVPRMFPTNNCETAIRAFILARLEAVDKEAGATLVALLADLDAELMEQMDRRWANEDSYDILRDRMISLDLPHAATTVLSADDQAKLDRARRLLAIGEPMAFRLVEEPEPEELPTSPKSLLR